MSLRKMASAVRARPSSKPLTGYEHKKPFAPPISTPFSKRNKHEWNEDRPPRMFCVTVKVLPVSSGTVQLTGSGDRTTICSGDLTRVGSGGDLMSVLPVSASASTSASLPSGASTFSLSSLLTSRASSWPGAAVLSCILTTMREP